MFVHGIVFAQNEGVILGFYKGLAPSVMKAAVSSMLMFGLYTRTHSALLAVFGDED